MMAKRKNEGKQNKRGRGCTTLLLLISACGLFAYISQQNSAPVTSPNAAPPVTRAASTSVPTVGGMMTNTPASTAIPPTVAEAAASPTPQGYIHQDDYGDDWPFTVPDGVVVCIPPGSRVVLRSNGGIYALNGRAQGDPESNWLMLDDIWRDHPDGITPKVYVGDIIQLGLSLCEGASSGVQNLVISTLAPAAQIVQEVRPANCAEAVAMGLTDVQAAQWDHLDRDGDGVACYGD